jgi:hypothetical protein
MPDPFTENEGPWRCPIEFEDRAVEAIALIGKSHAILLQTAEDFEYQSVVPEQKAIYFKEIKASNNRSQNEKLASKVFLAHIYEFGDLVQLLTAFGHSRKLLIVHLLNAARAGLESGNLLIPLICFRSIIEHCAHLHDSIRKLEIAEKPESFPSATQVFTETLAQVKKVLLSTRFDWSGVDGLDQEELKNKLANKKYEYKYIQDGKHIDLKAQQIMTSLDRLEKAIPQIRGTYELLCEFAHPNLGVLYTITMKSISGVDKQGIHWYSKLIGLGKPEIPDCLRSVFSGIFVKMAEVLETFKTDQERLAQLKAKMLDLTQACVRNDLKAQPADIDSYAECPCASGLKFKFCCRMS